MDASDLLSACLAFEAEHGTACLLIALSEIVNIRAEESGIEMIEDEDGGFGPRPARHELNTCATFSTAPNQ